MNEIWIEMHDGREIIGELVDMHEHAITLKRAAWLNRGHASPGDDTVNEDDIERIRVDVTLNARYVVAHMPVSGWSKYMDKFVRDAEALEEAERQPAPAPQTKKRGKR